MIKNKLIRKYFVLAAIIVFLFIVLGFFLMGFVAQALRPERNVKEVLPPIFFAQIIDHLNYSTKIEALQNMKSWHQDKMLPSLVLINQDAQIVYRTRPESKTDFEITLSDLQTLKKPYDFIYLSSQNNENNLRPPGREGPSFFMGPRPPPPPEFNQQVVIIRLSGEPVQYMAVLPHSMDERHMPTTKEKLIPFLGAGSLILSLLIGIGATLFIIYISVFKKIKEADEVISEMQRGNLKARFKIGRRDEFGEAMIRFNTMADEIEKLVEQMKFVELSRTKLLQELAHDLRTPISALKSLLETLDQKESQLSVDVKKEIIALSLREAKYFEHLVEDLLLLSQVSEPLYDQEQGQIILSDVLSIEVSDQVLRYQNSDQVKKIKFSSDILNSDFSIRGNSLLFKRMLKNILDNAVSFAQSEVRIQFYIANSSFEIRIEDDGPGFPEQQLSLYGHRKMSRQIIQDKNNKERLSIGLGSVVIRKICDLYRIQLLVENRQTSDSKQTGARIILKMNS